MSGIHKIYQNKESPPRAAEYFKECNFLALLIVWGG